MKSSSRIIIAVVFVIFAVSATGVWMFLERAGHFTLANRAELERQSRSSTAALIRNGAFPDSFSISFFFPKQTLEDACKIMEGTQVKFPSDLSGLPPDVEIQINKISIGCEAGKAIAALDLTGHSMSRGVSAAMNTRGFIRCAPSENSRSVRLTIELTDISARASLSFLRLKTWDFCSKLLASETMRHLGSKLQFTVPIPPVLNASIKLDEKVTAKVPDTGGSITARVTTEVVPLRSNVRMVGAVFTRKGAYFLADARFDPSAPISDAEAEHIFSNWSKAHVEDPSNASCSIRGEALAKAVSDFGLESPSQRRVSAKVVSHDKNLFEETFQFLGTGGFWVRLDSNDGGVVVTALSIDAEWLPERGLSLKIPIAAKLDARLRLLGDPGPSGGKDAAVGIIGWMYSKLEGIGQLSLYERAGHRAVVLKFSGDRQPFKASAGTDGNFKSDLGSVKVAKVGLDVVGNVNPEAIPQLILFTEAPTLVPLEKLKLEEGYQIVSKASAVSLSASPQSVKTTASGFNILLDVHVARVADDFPGKKNEQVQREMQNLANKEAAAANPIEGLEVQVTVGGLKFGKNNDIYRFIKDPGKRTVEFVKSSAKAAKEAFGSLNHEVDKFLRDPAGSIGDIPGNVQREGSRAVEKLKKLNPIPK
jgi:hypothetical protein